MSLIHYSLIALAASLSVTAALLADPRPALLSLLRTLSVPLTAGAGTLVKDAVSLKPLLPSSLHRHVTVVGLGISLD